MRKKYLVGSIIFIAVFCVVSIGLTAASRAKKDDIFKEVELFADSLTVVQTEYVEEPKPKDLIYGALKGMLASLDPHSQFMDPDTYNELKIDTEGKFGGIGIEITLKDGVLTVVTPIEDTPAWKAGIKANDHIVKINDVITRDITLTDAVKKMRGKPGELVVITVLRESEKKLLDFKIVRDYIKIKDIKEARILEDGIGYIRIVEFRENTPQDITAALDNLKKQNMTALILDLRNNPGGLLDSAVHVAGKFIEKGKKIVYTKGRKQSQNLEFFSNASKPYTDFPMVVLINDGSASGSEIVAGCLQDYKRAVIVGVKSFGKGSVQTVIPLSDGSALRLTTSKYFTPSGKVIHGKGVIPDIVVEESANVPLDNEIKSEKAAEIFDQIEQKEKPPLQKDELKYKKDAQVMRAIDVLKVLLIYRNNEVS